MSLNCYLVFSMDKMCHSGFRLCKKKTHKEPKLKALCENIRWTNPTGTGVWATLAHTIDILIQSGVDFQCKDTIFMPELFRHTRWIYLESPAGCIHATRQTLQSFLTQEPPILVWDQSRGLSVNWNRINTHRSQRPNGSLVVQNLDLRNQKECVLHFWLIGAYNI